jgi:hypothetical protein
MAGAGVLNTRMAISVMAGGALALQPAEPSDLLGDDICRLRNTDNLWSGKLALRSEVE